MVFDGQIFRPSCRAPATFACPCPRPRCRPWGCAEHCARCL